MTGLKLDAALARRQRRGLPAGLILCADTTVALGRQILGKPSDAAQAGTMLRQLGGRVHRVLTAVAVAVANGRTRAAALGVSREFAPLAAAAIRAYVASAEPMGNAGAYAIQGRAGAFARAIHGSYSGIMGLPLFETARLLRGVGMWPMSSTANPKANRHRWRGPARP